MSTRYIIELTDRKHVKFWEELLAQLTFVKVERPDDQGALKKTKKESELQDDLREGLHEIKDDLTGKHKMQSARAFLDELRD